MAGKRGGRKRGGVWKGMGSSPIGYRGLKITPEMIAAAKRYRKNNPMFRGRGSTRRGAGWFGKVLQIGGKIFTRKTLGSLAKKGAEAALRKRAEKGAEALFNRFGSRRRKRH